MKHIEKFKSFQMNEGRYEFRKPDQVSREEYNEGKSPKFRMPEKVSEGEYEEKKNQFQKKWL